MKKRAQGSHGLRFEKKCQKVFWLTFQFPTAIFLCLALVLGEVLITTRARISSLIDGSSGDGPANLMEYSRWNCCSFFLEKPLSRTTTILAHWNIMFILTETKCKLSHFSTIFNQCDFHNLTNYHRVPWKILRYKMQNYGSCMFWYIHHLFFHV